MCVNCLLVPAKGKRGMWRIDLSVLIFLLYLRGRSLLFYAKEEKEEFAKQ
jgi:hypothetical protein